MEKQGKEFNTGFRKRIFYDNIPGEAEKFCFAYLWKQNSNPGYDFINRVVKNRLYKKEDLSEIKTKIVNLNSKNIFTYRGYFSKN